MTCLLFITVMLVVEIQGFMTPELVTELFVDEVRHEQPFPVKLNISFPQLECAVISLDLQDDLGRHEISFNEQEVKKVPLGEKPGVEGCRIEAEFYVNKVPGNFHLATHAIHEKKIIPNQSIVMYHIIHSLQFGDLVVGQGPFYSLVVLTSCFFLLSLSLKPGRSYSGDVWPA